MDVRAITDDGAAAASGVAEAQVLLAFADAAVRGDDGARETARKALSRRLGSEALVDAAAVIAQFERMVRIADATGIPLDPATDVLTADLRAELGIDEYAAAANTRRSGAWKRGAAPVLRRTLLAFLDLWRRS